MIIMKFNKKHILIFTVLTLVLLFSATTMVVNNIALNSKLETHEESDVNYKQDILFDKLQTSQAEDVYEENDIRTSAYDLSVMERTWLSNIGGFGVQKDSDWFEIDITSGFLRLVVHLLFYDVEGNINLAVYNSVGTYVTGVSTTTDNEYIDYVLPSSGTYYLWIYGDNAGNTYDLLWDDIGTAATDDLYEQNDLYTTATDISTNERVWLSSINGLGIQSDSDWYRISITSDALRILIFCLFNDVSGNIDIDLWNSDRTTLLTYSWSTTNNEVIDYTASSAGTYYIQVYWGNGGNTYDLWWDDLPTGDDRYEENDLRTTAYGLSSMENTWLSSMTLGLGVQSDDDWFEIFISPGEELLAVSLTFSDAAGNINIAVYDSVGNFLTSSISTTNDEYIDLLLASSGTYYLRIYGDNAGNLYDLWWDDLAPPIDDNYEENDVYSSAYNIASREADWLTEVDGAGIQADDDWYQISITGGYENLVVDLQFTDADGNINVQIYASDGTTLVAGSYSTSDNEYIDTLLPSSGTYYLRVYGDNAGNLYNLWWDDLARPSDDNYEENDGYLTAYDISFDEQDWLSAVDGAGIQADYDYYQISITPGYENLIVSCIFSHASGNIDVAVFASDGTTLVTGSYSTTDNEYIDYILPSSGTYYLRVYGANAGNLYNLWWDDLVPDSLTVTSPTASSSWQAGSTQSITWTSTGSITNVDIDLYYLGVFHSSIASSTSNDGSYSWTLASSYANYADSYTIRIEDSSTPSTYDYSANYFEITVPDSLTVTSPTASSSWQAGSTHSITWTSTGSIANVDIDLYYLGVYNSTIASSTSNDGNYSWTLASSYTNYADSYQIHIEDSSNPSTYDDSAAYFEITSAVTNGDGGIPGYNLSVLIISLIGISIILMRKRTKKLTKS